MFEGWLGGVWEVSGGIWVVFMNTKGAQMCFGVYLGSPSLHYWVVTLIWHSPERHNFFYLTIIRHQNIKMSIYKVDENHWVMWLFCFLVPVRKILKNTVALDHPVFYFQWGLQKCRKADITYLLYFLNISTAHTKLKFHKLYKRQIVMPCKYVLALLHMPPYCADKSVREAIV